MILYDVSQSKPLGHPRCYGSDRRLLLLKLHGNETHIELLLQLEELVDGKTLYLVQALKRRDVLQGRHWSEVLQGLDLLLLLFHQLLLDLKVNLGTLLLVLMQLLLQVLRLGQKGIRAPGLLIVVQRQHVLLSVAVLQLFLRAEIVFIIGVSDSSQGVQIDEPFGHLAVDHVRTLSIIVFGFGVFHALVNVVDDAFPGRELHETLGMVSSGNGAPANVDIHHAKRHASSHWEVELVLLCLNLVHILGLFHLLDRVVVVQRHYGGVKVLGHLLVRLLHLLRDCPELRVLLQVLGQLRWLRRLLYNHSLLLHRLALHVLEILLKVNCLQNVVDIWLGPGSRRLNA